MRSRFSGRAVPAIPAHKARISRSGPRNSVVASAACFTPRAARSNPIRVGFEAGPRPRATIEPERSMATHSVLLPPPSNPRTHCMVLEYLRIRPSTDLVVEAVLKQGPQRWPEIQGPLVCRTLSFRLRQIPHLGLAFAPARLPRILSPVVKIRRRTVPVQYQVASQRLRAFRNASLPRLLAAVLLLCSCGCGKTPPAADRDPSRVPGAELQQDRKTDRGSTKRTEHGAVKAEFRNVMFHLTATAAAHLEQVSGELWPVGQYDVPVFDDKTSFEVHIATGTVSIAPDALAAIMNEHVFVRRDSPIKDIFVQIKEDRLVIKGKLHRKGDLPFETGGELTLNADGRLRLHTEKVKALHLPVKKAMSLVGIDLANVINTSKIPGMDTDKNDLIFDLAELLPPPHIRGKISAARLRRNAIVVVYGTGGDAPAETGAGGEATGSQASAVSSDRSSRAPSGNYMLFRGNRVKFGKLTMENTDL